MAHAYSHVLIHLIWATRFRTPWLDLPIRQRVFAYISGICRNLESPLRIAGGIEDHVHLLIELHPSVALADAVRDIKANSSRFVHETWGNLPDFAWQKRYSAFSVSRSGQDDVYRYVENKVEHHRSRPFLDELREFKERHGMPFDPNEEFD